MIGHTIVSSNLAQDHINDNIQLYLLLNKRSKRLIKQFNNGYCHGLAVVAAYAQYISAQPNKTEACDDWQWFQDIMKKLADWDGRLAALTEDDNKQIERFISLIEFYQHITCYLSDSTQGNLEHYFTDTAHRILTLEYTVGGLFSAADFTKPLQKESLINELLKYDQRLVMVSCGGHALSLFKTGDQVTLYNANHKSGLQVFNMQNPDALIQAIFTAYHYDPAQPSPIGFRIFTFDEQPQPYENAQILLKQLSPPLTNQYAGNKRNYTALHMAVRSGSMDAASYYIMKGIDINVKTADGQSAYDIASSRRYSDIAWMLLLCEKPEPVNDKYFGLSFFEPEKEHPKDDNNETLETVSKHSP